MTVYSVLMFSVAVLFLIIGIAVRGGNTKLIHDYHQTGIKEADLPEYGKAFANGLFTFSAALLAGGVIALFGESRSLIFASVAVLLAGIILAIVLLVRAQKKYNGGIF